MPMNLLPLRCLPVLLLCLWVLAGCSGDGDADVDPGTASPADNSLKGRLASILLTEGDLPAGLQGGGLIFSTNGDVAGSFPEELERLQELGRLLGVDYTFIPTETLPESVPLRGGIQNSASVYISATGASESFLETVAQARANDWELGYPELDDFNVVELDRPVGDESLWLRITGIQSDCIIETPPGVSPDALPSATCPPPRLVVDDFVIFRAGRVRSLVKVLSTHPIVASEDVYAGQVQAWAEIVVERARDTFGERAS